MTWYQKSIIKEYSEHGIEIFRVSDISRVLGGILDDSRLQDIWIRGEVTNYRPHASGHRYFSLSEKSDAGISLLHCVMWRSDAQRLSFSPKDGMDVIVFGSIGHYAPQGKYQLYVRDMRHAGEGEKHLMVERWKSELASEGHFSEERKKPLPQYPSRVGVVTSDTGAVLQDIRNVIERRYPLEILVSPTAVQGDTAHLEIVKAISRIDGKADVIIVARGGGSFEDLFPFNQPDVVRAISACTTPVVSAIGHETDYTLVDLAADVRAPTPSAAAELAVPDRAQLIADLAEKKNKMGSVLLARVDRAAREVEDLRERISPKRLEKRVMQRREDLAVITERLVRAYLSLIERERLKLSGVRSMLEARNPKNVLERGYCIMEMDGRVVRSVTQCSPGDRAVVRMKDGKAGLVIEDVYYDREV